MTAAPGSKTKRPLKGRAATLAAARIAREAAQAEAAATAAAAVISTRDDGDSRADVPDHEGDDALDAASADGEEPTAPAVVGRPSALVLAESASALDVAESSSPVLAVLIGRAPGSAKAGAPGAPVDDDIFAAASNGQVPVDNASSRRGAGRMVDFNEDGIDDNQDEDVDDAIDEVPARTADHADQDAMDVDDETSASVGGHAEAAATAGDEQDDEADENDDEDDEDGPAAPTPTPSSPDAAISLPSATSAPIVRGLPYKRGRAGRGRGRGRGGIGGGGFVSAPTTAATSARASPGKEDDVAEPPVSDPAVSTATAGPSSLAKPPRNRKAQELKALKRQRDYERAAELDACVAVPYRLLSPTFADLVCRRSTDAASSPSLSGSASRSRVARPRTFSRLPTSSPTGESGRSTSLTNASRRSLP